MALKYKDSKYLDYAGALQIPSDIPLDIRAVVETIADLQNTSTWRGADGTLSKTTAYKGMIVAVEGTNELYMCIDPLQISSSAGWKLIGDVSDISTAISNINASLADISTNVVDLSTKMINANASIADISTRLTYVNTSINDLSTRIADLSTQVINNELATSTAINQIKDSVGLDSSLKVQWAQSTSTAFGGDSSITNVIDQMAVRILNDNASLADLSTNVGNLTTSMSNANASIADLSTRIKTVENTSYVHTIKASTTNASYIDVTPINTSDGNVTIGIDPKIVSMTNASSNNTGLVDAWDVKQYILNNTSTHISMMVIADASLDERVKALNDDTSAGGEPTAEHKKYLNIIYFVQPTDTSTHDVYDEYVITDNGTRTGSGYAKEKVGSTRIDLTPYAKITDVNASLAIRDASITMADTSINTIENTLKNGVVTNINVSTKTAFVTVQPTSASTGNVSLGIDISVCDTYTTSTSTAEGMTSAKYVNEYVNYRLEWTEID